MKYLLIAVIAYVIGSISFAIIFSKIFKNDDVRNHGSKNAGATNMVRAFGIKMGFLTFLGDTLKGTFAAFLGNKIGGDTGMYIAIIAVVLGHDYPLFMRFKGGKGVSTSFGALFYVAPIPLLICCAIVMTIAFLTRIVSYGSLIAAIAAPIFIGLLMNPFDARALYVTIFLALLIIYRHKANIVRILKGEEKKL